MVQFRAFVFYVVASTLYGMDGRQQISCGTRLLLRRSLLYATYICLIGELIGWTRVDGVSPAARRTMHIRSLTTLCLFGLAAVVALKYPLVGLGICICCLVVYLKPDPPGAGKSA